MAQIQQNSDGTYSSTYSAVELSLIKSLKAETDARILGDQELWAITTDLTNRTKALEDAGINAADIQLLIGQNTTRIQDMELEINRLANSVIIESYGKDAIDKLAIEWRIEQIAHTFDIPSNHMFDQAIMDDLKVGYKHYHAANINEPHDNHIPENTMQRYTINAFASRPKKVTFTIRYADRLVVAIDEQVVATYIDSNGNFNTTAKILTVDLKEGWTKIQFLLANETQAGGLVITSDLYEQADYLSCLDYTHGLITGNRIQAGALDERHFSPNMDLSVHTIHATATDVPGVIIGNADEKGILQIADGTISKSKDEPFVFSEGIRVNGFIRVTQLLIDNDFVRAGDGMIVKTIKDEYGYTKMYEIINDLRLVSGGSIHITGDGQKGYTITNDLLIEVNPGLTIQGDPIHGYIITNAMELHSDGGIEVTGDAVDGYIVKNIMELTADPGIIKVTGNAWSGYHLQNVLQILAGGGIDIQGSISSGKITIYNAMKLTSDYGIINVTGNPRDGYKLENVLRIEAGGGITIQGAVNSGLVTVINNMSLVSGGGIGVTGNAQSGYTITNTMSLTSGGGISITGDAKSGYRIANSMSLTGSGIASVSGSATSGYNVYVPSPHVTDVSAGTLISVSDSGGNHQVSVNTTALDQRIADKAPANTTDMIPAIAAPNQGMSGNHTINPNLPSWVNISTDGAYGSILSGYIPAGADALCILTQGGYKGSSASGVLQIRLRLYDENGRNPAIIVVDRNLSNVDLGGDTSGAFPGYNAQIEVFSLVAAPKARHVDIHVTMYKTSGSGNLYGRVRECWAQKYSDPNPHSGWDGITKRIW